MNGMMRRETQEAIEAGERAPGSLYAAREKPGRARNRGIYDMLGGGFFSTMIKRSKMEDAAALMEQTEAAIRYIEPTVNQLRQQMQER